jgi:hypothetical protein
MPLTLSTRAVRWLLALTLAGHGLVFPSEVRADERACIAAAENETPLRKAGKLQEALKELAVCTATTCSSEIREECTKRIAEVQAALPTVVLGATDEARNDIGNVLVTLDGVPLRAALDGRALAVDPGSHVLRFEAPGRIPAEKSVIFREGEKDRPVLVVLAIAPEGRGVAAARAERSWNGRWTWAILSGVVGVAGVATGSAFGLAARSDWSSSQAACNSNNCPSAQARNVAITDQESASSRALISTVAFGIGAAGLAGGLLLWLTAPARNAGGTRGGVNVTPMFGTENGMSVRGSF